MRLFTAIPVGAAAVSALAALAGEARRVLANRGVGTAVSWSAVEKAHLTLHFLGHLRDDRSAAIVEACGRPLAARGFGLRLGAAGLFPSRGRPRVLWTAVDGDVPALRAAHAELGARLSGLGVVLDERPFTPHVTLARFRAPGPPSAVREPLATLRPRPVEWRVREIVLFESQLSPKGATHLARAVAPLAEGC